ncbi:unnamed protein product [Aspergillus oryzae]|uniref:Unnamed protein product n=2 Tax=Aspergillus oryzae TaxID=5062 RepID=A0AAN4YFE3_ASPOZ|nr:unnamed protein product [Aspergillus oryzae]GMF88441.1 unnamed protein product [Aspergillus oryzae]GMG00784.1 unnamed protein product [Aspergillus oryzae]GMG26163.1 unnamed protein product [Aspergillus oryzae]GMG49340.1 unnamed protein product [Aspergillus oryzae var. brunneus]
MSAMVGQPSLILLYSAFLIELTICIAVPSRLAVMDRILAPIRRGGARKGNAFKAKKRAIAATNTPSPFLSLDPIETQGLPYALANIQDVRDLSVGDLTSDENSNPAFELGSLAIRAYGCEADLYVEAETVHT